MPGRTPPTEGAIGNFARFGTLAGAALPGKPGDPEPPPPAAFSMDKLIAAARAHPEILRDQPEDVRRLITSGKLGPIPEQQLIGDLGRRLVYNWRDAGQIPNYWGQGEGATYHVPAGPGGAAVITNTPGGLFSPSSATVKAGGRTIPLEQRWNEQLMPSFSAFSGQGQQAARLNAEAVAQLLHGVFPVQPAARR